MEYRPRYQMDGPYNEQEQATGYPPSAFQIVPPAPVQPSQYPDYASFPPQYDRAPPPVYPPQYAQQYPPQLPPPPLHPHQPQLHQQQHQQHQQHYHQQHHHQQHHQQHHHQHQQQHHQAHHQHHQQRHQQHHQQHRHQQPSPPPPPYANPTYLPATLPPPAPVYAPPAPVVEQQSQDEPKPDYQLLLLSLAESYFDAAQSRAGSAAQSNRVTDFDRYYKLVATGLACLEVVLKNWRLEPRMEAMIRLRYASILHEETDNIMEAETELSKGITLCERNRLMDSKYNLQHVLVSVMYRKNPKAALKYLDSVVRDAEAYQHIPWEYAFRFLRVSLSLDLCTPNETSSALQNLRSISASASRHGDHVIFVLGGILEALAYLRSSDEDVIEPAQRAIAAARSFQLESLAVEYPQLVTFIHILDLLCSLMESNTTQAMSKMQTLRAMLDQVTQEQSKRFSTDGSFSVPVGRGPSSNLLPPTAGGLISGGHEGLDLLNFTWMPAREIYALGFLLDGATTSHRNTLDGHKAEKSLEEGLKMASDPGHSTTAPQSLALASSWVAWRKMLRCYMRLHLAFLQCTRTDWASARRSLDELQKDSKGLDPDPAELLLSLVDLVSGIIYQGTGDVVAALALFKRAPVSLESLCKAPSNASQRGLLDVSILANLNKILILQDQSQPEHEKVEPLFAALEPICLSHPNPSIQAAFHLLKATSHPTDPGIKRKNNLQAALNAATSVANIQLKCITLNFMSWKFFRGVVGEQAEKSSRAGLKLANSSSNILWSNVAEGMLADTLEVQGKLDEANAVREKAETLADRIVPALLAARERGATNQAMGTLGTPST